MSVPVTSKLLVPLLLSLASTVAGAACVPVTGVVRMEPDFSCKVVGAMPAGTPAALFSTTCFKTHLALSGFPAGEGYSGVTQETVALVSAGPNVPPQPVPALAVVAPSAPDKAQRLVQTARSAITIGHGPRSTTIYTTDVIINQPSSQNPLLPELTTEQIRIAGTNGQGAFRNASGYLTLTGTSIGAPARVTGEICVP